MGLYARRKRCRRCWGLEAAAGADLLLLTPLMSFVH
jgi:hypothetical protein